MNDKVDSESFKKLKKLKELRLQHMKIIARIDNLSGDSFTNQLDILRLKKKLIVLEKTIRLMESKIIPDLDA